LNKENEFQNEVNLAKPATPQFAKKTLIVSGSKLKLKQKPVEIPEIETFR